VKVRLLAMVCLVATVSAVVAGEGPRMMSLGEVTVPATVLMKQLEGRVTRLEGLSLKPTPNVVLEGAEPAFILPVVGSAGAFRTEGTLVNRRTQPQKIAVYYWPIGAGASNCNVNGQFFVLDASKKYFFADLVKDVFQQSGFGSVIVIGVDSANSADANARIDGNVRIWSGSEGSGTTSQNFPSMSVQVPAGSQSAFGLRSDDSFRTNWGIFNYDSKERTFDIVFDGPLNRSQGTFIVPPCSLVQTRVPGGPYGPLEILFAPQDGGGLFYAYGSSVDNVSLDAWSVPARK